MTGPLRAVFDTSIIALELISASEVRIVRAIYPELNAPYDAAHGWFLLVDIACEAHLDLTGQLQEVLGDAMEHGKVADVLVATTEVQRSALWRLRHTLTEAHKNYGMGMSHDIAVPIAHIPQFVTQAGKAVSAAFPQAEIACVGHVGDGNLHYNVMFEHTVWEAVVDKPGLRAAVYKVVYDIAARMNGTFSAEHGIGALHVAEMRTYKLAIELEMMNGIKALFDPRNLMNPGRVLPG